MSLLAPFCCSKIEQTIKESDLTIGLVGNPNSGKTTIFNGLTGSTQRVGNWPGVTVEKKTGVFQVEQLTVNVVDLPGTYSLTIVNESSSIDERIACEFILQREADLIVNILDANNLERNLYLTMQLLEMQVPMVIAVNMMDVAQQHGVSVLVQQLQKKLGCVVIPLEARKGKGIQELKKAIVKSITQNQCKSVTQLPFSKPLSSAIENLSQQLVSIPAPAAVDHKNYHDWLAIRLLEDDHFARKSITPEMQICVAEQQQHIREIVNEDADILLADARYQFIQTLINSCVIKNAHANKTWTKRIDNLVLNRFMGIPIFLGVMYSLFFFSINIGGAFQDFFDMGSHTIFVEGLGHVLNGMGLPTWLTVLLANGVGKGINTTITFIPVIGAMFLFLAFLEDSGYMARAAFVIDRLMRALGLPGKSFVPMIVGFGCNVPAIMATRTLENKRDRILTVMMSPFMSCGARLAIFAVFTAAFFPVGGQDIVFLLYIIGIAMAMLTGFMLRKTVLKGEPAPLVMELPPYHLPNIRTLLLHAWQRLKGFVIRAGKLIVPICVLIGALNALNLDGSINSGEGDVHSLLSAVGRLMTPIFSPMGIDQNNWPATVGLVTGVLAKEVVIGTLNTIYSQVGQLALLQDSGFHFWAGLHEAFASIPANLSQLGSALGNPVLAKAPVHTLSQNVYGLMYQRFDGQVGAIAYLLFVLLYFPCVSTTAAMLREVSRGWTIFSVLWSTGMAYCVAVGFYQLATLTRHPGSSLMWLAGIALAVGLFLFSVRRWAEGKTKLSAKAVTAEVV
jgi:ferrous iron transport protein B